MGGFFCCFLLLSLDRPLNPYSMHKRTQFGKRFLLLKKKNRNQTSHLPQIQYNPFHGFKRCPLSPSCALIMAFASFLTVRVCIGWGWFLCFLAIEWLKHHNC